MTSRSCERHLYVIIVHKCIPTWVRLSNKQNLGGRIFNCGFRKTHSQTVTLLHNSPGLLNTEYVAPCVVSLFGDNPGGGARLLQESGSSARQKTLKADHVPEQNTQPQT